jgi:signal transduction histidine kinase
MVVAQPIYNCLEISVKNIGYGIAPAEQTHIFERFRRGKGATQKAIPGTGLGLALVKSLVRHLHGKIDLDSEYNPDGVGETTFKVTLPRSLNNVSTLE